MQESFPGMPLKFLAKLKKNNNKEWFAEHREEYEFEFLLPAQNFVVELGEKLQKIFPELIAIPRIDKSIFRLHRDVRFSGDKSPFKTNLGVFLWEGPAKKMEASGFYVHIEPGYIMIAAGLYMFTKENLTVFREAVDSPEGGKSLDRLVTKILSKGDYQLGGQTYKRVPKGFPPEHPYARYLLHGGMHVYYETKDIKNIPGDFASFCFGHLKNLSPLHSWMQEYIFSR